jgi:Ser-tRNA(Ala) deacylase AlaX
MDNNNQCTELIHLTYDGNFQLETDAKVLSYCILSDEPSEAKTVRIELQLDQTTMHPQGGGQPTDIGTIRPHPESNYSVQIDKVTIDRGTGVVTHAGSMTLPADVSETIESTIFSPSTSVTVSVDPANRRILSECHTAGHVVDAAMTRCEAELPPTKGYHFMDGPYVEYRGTLENKEEFLERLKGVYLVSAY